MTDQTEYFSMQGRVYLGERNPDGSRGPAKWVYDASTLSWEQSVEREEKRESHTGSRSLGATLKTSRDLNVTLTLGQINSDHVALATDGKRVDIATGTVTDEALGNVEAGDVHALEYSAVSTVALEDGTAVPLVVDVDYIVNEDSGFVRFLTTKTGVTASYSYAAHSVVTVLSGSNKAYYLLFDGLNTVDDTSLKCVGEVYNLDFDPSNELGFIHESFGEIQLTGRAKLDSFRQPDPKWGPYARVKLIAPPAAP